MAGEPMNAKATVESFGTVYLHDSMLTSFEVLTAEARCHLRLHAAALLRAKGEGTFNPLVRYSPAILTIEGVREVCFEGRYQLNATVVDTDARPLPDGEHVEFVVEVTGGHDAEAYYVKIRIVGRRLRLAPDEFIRGAIAVSDRQNAYLRARGAEGGGDLDERRGAEEVQAGFRDGGLGEGRGQRITSTSALVGTGSSSNRVARRRRKRRRA
jgi:hypothetical protein